MMGAIETAIQLITAKDTAAAIEELSRDPEGTRFLDCMAELYWKQKDLASSLAIAQAGIGIALARAVSAEKDLAYERRSTAKALCYNIASFTWNGWHEPGIAITNSDLAAGLDAAKANLRLARELNKGDLPLSRAYWMLAGHELSAEDRASAIKHYQDGQRHAEAAGSKQDSLLCKAFAHMVDVLNDPNHAEARRRLEATKTELKKEKDGEEFIRQLDTAYAVFSRKP